MAARSGRPSMSLFSLTDASVGWLGSRECVVRSSLSGAYSSIFLYLLHLILLVLDQLMILFPQDKFLFGYTHSVGAQI
jgi:hypothetical protein